VSTINLSPLFHQLHPALLTIFDLLDTEIQNLLASSDGGDELLEDISYSLTSRSVFSDPTSSATMHIPKFANN